MTMKTCLIVDDSRVVRKFARRILEDLSLQVDEAEDGAVALDRCQERMPDAILLDWNMPISDGPEFLARLRQTPGGDAPKIIFCTTRTDLPNIARAVEIGADEYIMKPFTADIVREKLESVGVL